MTVKTDYFDTFILYTKKIEPSLSEVEVVRNLLIENYVTFCFSLINCKSMA